MRPTFAQKVNHSMDRILHDGKSEEPRQRPRRRAGLVYFGGDDDDDDDVLADESKRRANESNGNRMNASAHERQVGRRRRRSQPTGFAPHSSPAHRTPTTATTATTTTAKRATTNSAPSGRLIHRLLAGLAPAPPQLLILALILAGGLSTLVQSSNHHVRALSPASTASSSSSESRELKHEPVPETTDAAAVALDRVSPLVQTAEAPPNVPSSAAELVQSQASNVRVATSLDKTTSSLNVRESLSIDLDSNREQQQRRWRRRRPQASRRDHRDDRRGDAAADKAKDPVHRLLVRQLTDLIMNHEPETVAARMDGARVLGRMSSADSSGKSNTYINNNNNDDNNLDRNSEKASAQLEPALLVAAHPDTPTQDMPTSAANPDELADNYMATSSSAGAGQELDLGGGAPSVNAQVGSSEMVAGETMAATCPPDYDDVSGGLEGGINVESAEQLADSLIGPANRSVNGEPHRSLSQQQQQQQPLGPQCVHPGVRMIELITKIITPILFTIIIIVGLLGNIIVMMVILEDRQTERELTPTNLLILDLSLADLSFIIFCIPFTGWDYSVGHWVFGSLWCKFNQYLIVVCALSSIYTLVLMSCDRFMAIVYPIECISYRTSKNTLYAIYIKWIVILLMASPTIAMHGLIDLPMDQHQYACRFLTDQYDPLSFQITFFITSYLFPLILIFCLYLSLLNKLWFGTKPHGHKESLKMLESKKKVTWLVAGIVVVFAICWCPIQVMLILMRLKSHKITATYVAIQVFAHTLGYMNSCVNPIVYAFASETFTNSFKRSVFGRFFRTLFCMSVGPDEMGHSRPGYSYHSARPSNAAFQNTTSLNHTTTNNNNNSSSNSNSNSNNINNSTINNGDGGNKLVSVYHNNQGNSVVHHQTARDLGGGGGGGGDDSITCSTKTSQILNSCQSSSDNNSNGGRQMAASPLEPRDRGISPMVGVIGKSMSDNVRVRDEKLQSRPETVLIPREATISSRDGESDLMRTKLGPPAKQQLVARVVRTGNNQAAQRCETACYQQEELMGP